MLGAELPTEDMRVTLLASGSSGNATLFEAGGKTILVDGGISPEALTRSLMRLSVPSPSAVIITHAHGDHVGEAVALAEAFALTVYVTESSARVLRLGSAKVRIYGARQPFDVAGFDVAPLPLPHDAAQVALVVAHAGRSAAIVTDLGEVPPALEAHVAGCDLLCLESNHDEDMLARGPYPAFLKRRVASSRGHLSNRQAHAFIARLSPRTRALGLVHLSRTNNRPDLALASARDALGGRDVHLFAAKPAGAQTIDLASLGAPHAPLARPHRRSVQLELPGVR